MPDPSRERGRRGARVLVWIVLLPLLLFAALFAISNRAPVTIGLWPFFDGIETPLFLALIGALYLGFVFGAAVAWLSGAASRARLRAAAKRAEDLARENAALSARVEEVKTRPAPPASPPAPPFG